MPAPENPPASTRPGPSGSRLVWIVGILMAGALVFYFGSLWIGKKAVDSAATTVQKTVSAAKHAVVAMAEAFQPEFITQTFVEYTGTAVKGTEGNILEVATAEETERFTRTSNVVWFDRVVPVGTTVSDISVPATYRFHIDLRGPWDLAAYDGRLVVVAPPVRPSLPVAFDTARMEKKTKSGWARWDAEENLAELERELTGKLGERAADADMFGKVREASRLAIAKFVRDWLQTGQHWGDSAYREIVIVFPDETQQGSLMERPATLRWQAPGAEKGETKSVLP